MLAIQTIRHHDNTLDRRSARGPVIRETGSKYPGCCDLKQGFARVRCRDCGHEYLLANEFVARLAKR
jgi:hypothetical protein